MKQNRFLAVLLVIALAAGLCSVSAAVAEEPDLPECKGYIVKLRDNMMMTMSMDSDAEVLGSRMYLVDDLDEVYTLYGAGAVEFIEPNYRIQMYGAADEPLYQSGDLWFLNGTYGIDAATAWDQGLDGTGVTVAVLDTGLFAHADFNNTTIKNGYNATNDGGTYADVAWHGTAVTGVIAAGVNNYGMVGAAPKATIVPVRVFDKNKAGYISYVINGLNYAIQKKVDVINMSLGSSDASISLDTVVKNAVNAGIIVVAAAGNDGNSVLNYPAASPGAIGVGATDSYGEVASYSQKNESVWVTAPGSAIMTTYSEDYKYTTTNGTSFASPCVAAMAALAKQYAKAQGQSLTPNEFAQLLRLTAIDAGDEGYDYRYGHGRVNTAQMLAGMAPKTVHYELDGGSWSGSTPATQYIPYSTATVALTDGVPVRQGQFFGGWYEDAQCSGTRVTSFIPADGGDRVFYAKWIPDKTTLASVILNGYAAETTNDGAEWTAYLPAGTAIPSAEDAQITVTYAYTGNEYTLGHKIRSLGAGKWAIDVTQDAFDDNYEATYSLTADNTTYHAPQLAQAQTAAVQGQARPMSLDGNTHAELFEADLATWFRDEDDDTLNYILSENDQTVDAIVGLSISGSHLSYKPPVATAGTTVTFAVTAMDGRFEGAKVDVSVVVDELPVSTPTLLSRTGTYDAAAPEEVAVGFTAYDNTLRGLTVGETTLVEDTDYVVSVDGVITLSSQDESVYPTCAVFQPAFLRALDNGDTVVTLHFDRLLGSGALAEQSLTYTITVTHSCVSGHSWNDGEVTTAPGCTSVGTRTYTCANCRETRTEEIAATGHSWNDGEVTTAPGCTSVGTRTYTCANCRETRTEEIAATGHTYADGACTACGTADPDAPPAGDKDTPGDDQPGEDGNTPPDGGSNTGSSTTSNTNTNTGNPSGSSSAEQVPAETVEERGDHTVTTVSAEDGSKTITATWDSGKQAVTQVSARGDTTITVTTPSGDTMAVILLPAVPAAVISFRDVPDNAWYKDEVAQAAAYGLFSGQPDGSFAPKKTMTRGMLVTVLYNLSGKPGFGTGTDVFADVGGRWYADAAEWGFSTGVTTGTGGSRFSPEQDVTREQLVTMLYRFAELFGAESENRAEINDFPDSGEVSGYARDAMKWAVAEGLISGRAAGDRNHIAPKDTATRAEAAAIFLRFVSYLKK